MNSIEVLHYIPRVLIGVLSVADTFLVYKIGEYRYNKRVAFVAAMLFAIMPSGWIISRILLESFQLPLILTSILFALRISGQNQRLDQPHHDKRREVNIILIIISGIFLGLAIFTKIPGCALIPVLAYLVFVNSNRNLKHLIIWFTPVILIPLLWPAYSLAIGEFDKFVEGLFWQADRADRGPYGIIDLFSPDPIFKIIEIYAFDPLLVILGTAGIGFAAIRRDYFPVLWLLPIIVFFSLLGFVRTFFLIPMLPVFSIGAAVLIVALLDKVNIPRISKLVSVTSISTIMIFGLISSLLLVNTNVNSTYFKLYSLVTEYLPENTRGDPDRDHDVTVVGNDWVISGLSWIPKYIYDKDHEFKKFYSRAQVDTKNVLLVVDKRLKDTLSADIIENQTRQVKSFYVGGTNTIYRLNDSPRYDYDTYPYASMRDNRGIGAIEIKSNY